MVENTTQDVRATTNTRGTLNTAIAVCAANGHTLDNLKPNDHTRSLAPGTLAQCTECLAYLRWYKKRAMGEAYSTTCRKNPPSIVTLTDRNDKGETLWGMPVVDPRKSPSITLERELHNMSMQQRTAYDGLTLNEWAQEIHAYARDKGWWDTPTDRNFGDLMSLLHTEISEAYEEYRNGHAPDERYYNADRPVFAADGTLLAKPEGIPSELADIMIRLFDLFGHYGIDIEQVLIEKHIYNLYRSYRHGGKVT